MLCSENRKEDRQSKAKRRREIEIADRPVTAALLHLGIRVLTAVQGREIVCVETKASRQGKIERQIERMRDRIGTWRKLAQNNEATHTSVDAKVAVVRVQGLNSSDVRRSLDHLQGTNTISNQLRLAIIELQQLHF